MLIEALIFTILTASFKSFSSGLNFGHMKSMIPSASSFHEPFKVPGWDVLHQKVLDTSNGKSLDNQLIIRNSGIGLAHTDSKLRSFGTAEDPRVTFYRDTAAW